MMLTLSSPVYSQISKQAREAGMSVAAYINKLCSDAVNQ